jgi:hypothetical protein
MLGAIGGMIALGVATAATVYGYFQARIFTRKKLAFVDAAQSGAAPILAGVGAAVLGGIVASIPIIPFVGAGTAILFGIGVGAGVAGGQSDIKHRRLKA